MDKKKGGLSLLIGIGRKKVGSDGAADVSDKSSGSLPDEGSDSADMAVDNLADTMGVPEDQKDSFRSDFMAAVRACYDSWASKDKESY